ncbi:ketopantoate reductase family protein [Jatrophihabitans endophyticus]|uniref:ketopantoate reductase family protein n=1 Tax=Jatrophihabitans endophyticus TaxID=1206085 RepID=UPI0019DE097E|nr:2-dehydropantoate 2-reductase N-terminal domain-containing protein [Jatrophihabitans endophyticus]MBE7189276.1 NAD(P)-binding domain-containing protein [Jatrophihabitans endophyticus]
MRYVILGAGAIGGALGARLVEAGHEVALLARGEHARVMRRDGLHVQVPDRTLHVRPAVVDDPAELGLRGDDVLVLAVKSQQTEALLDAVAGLPVSGGGVAADDLPIISAQNGVANEDVLLRRFARVYGTCVMCPAEQLEPGLVVASGGPFTGAFDTGRYPHGVDDVAETFARDVAASTCIAAARPDIMRWKYAKLLRNLANALDALLGADLDDDARAVADGIAGRARDEALACFEAAGVDHVGDDEWRDYRFGRIAPQPIDGRARSGSSTWQSVTRGTGNVEVDYLNGEIVLLGRRHGLSTPVNLTLQREVNAVSARGGRPGELTAGDLLDRVP